MTQCSDSYRFPFLPIDSHFNSRIQAKQKPDSSGSISGSSLRTDPDSDSDSDPDFLLTPDF